MSTPEVPFRCPIYLPAEIRAGNAAAWSLQAQLPEGTLVFYILTAVIGNVPTRVTVGGDGVAVDGTGAATFHLSSATTATWVAGRYNWVAFAVDADANRSELASGVINITPDPAGTNPVDPRTDDEKLLAQVKALIAGRALDDVQMYKIGNRELTKMLMSELHKWQATLEARVRNARRRKRGNKQIGRIAHVTFGGGC